jgi:hypothetical protein
VVPLLEKLLQGEGWTAKVVSHERLGRVATNAGEDWSEDLLILDLAAQARDQSEVLIPVQAYLPILASLRRQIRDVVEDAGGQQLEYTFSETYHERSLMFRYQSGTVLGYVLVRIFPKTERDDERLTRLELTVHEQPAE